MENRPAIDQEKISIECDVKKVNWNMITSTPFEKYNSPFHVIVKDPPYELCLNISYQALNLDMIL